MRATTLSSGVIEDYQSWLSERGKSANTTKAYGSDLNEFLKWTASPSLSMTVFEVQAMAWLNEYRRVAKPKTTNRRLTSLRGFARWAGLPNPLSEYEAPPVPKTFPHPIPEGHAGVLKMIDVAPSFDGQALIAMCGLEGMRVSEARAIAPAHVDLDEMMIEVKGKREKIRRIPLSEEAWSFIGMSYMHATRTSMHTPLVCYQDRYARKLITNCAARAGLRRHVSSHDLRATFATEVYNRTGDIRLVQELLGHESVETTQIYVGILEGKMRSAVDFRDED